jgi:transposase
MQDTDLFQAALGLFSPWLVERCTFDPEQKQLDIYIDFSRGGEFTCPECGRTGCKAYDTLDKSWRHLNFFQHVTYLHVRTPRVECPNCGVKQVPVPWAREASGFTLLFEAFIMTMAKGMPVNAIARLVGEHDTRIWRILHHYVEKARGEQDYSQVRTVGMDETSSRRGHNYITVFVDMDKSKVLFATPGKDAATLTAFKKDLEAHGGRAENIKQACCDMSRAFIRGIEDTFENSSITFDKFHIVKIINEALDEIRRIEQKTRPELKKTRFAWLKNPQNLTVKQQVVIETLNVPKLNLKTAKGYQIKLTFQDLYDQPKEKAEEFLKRWYFWATHSRLKPMIEAARTIKRHWDGVLAWFDSGITNGVLEGINSLIQAAKAKARGYRSTRNLITVVYLIAGKLNLNITLGDQSPRPPGVYRFKAAG